ATAHSAIGAAVAESDIVDGDRVVEACEGRMVDEFVSRGRSRARHCQRLQARFVTVAERSCPGRAEILEYAGHLTLIREHVTGPARAVGFARVIRPAHVVAVLACLVLCRLPVR